MVGEPKCIKFKGTFPLAKAHVLSYPYLQPPHTGNLQLHPKFMQG